MRKSLVIASLFFSARAGAETPMVLSYTGSLEAAGGEAVPDGSYEMTFRLFDTMDNAAGVLWGEQIQVELERGVFTVELGQIEPLSTELFLDAPSVWFEIQVVDEVLSPRLPIASVPYALVSGASEELMCEGCVTDVEADPGSVQLRVSGSCMGGKGMTGVNEDGTVACGDFSPGGPDYAVFGSCEAGQFVQGLSSQTGAVICSDDTVGGDISCAVGSSIRAIASDGTVTCHTDSDSGGDINAVTAGTGLSGGGTTGSVTVSADTSYLQRRVATSCAAGSSIRSISSTGAVTCETDSDSGGDITGVTAGTGLTGGGTSGAPTLSADTNYLQRKVTGSCTVGNSIRSIASDGSVTCEPTTQTLVCVNVTAIASSGSVSAVATCAAGYTVTGGGFAKSSATNIEDTYPSGNGWRCKVNGGGTCYARCCQLQ